MRDPGLHPINRAEKSLGRSYTSDCADVETLCAIDAAKLSAWEVYFRAAMRDQVIERIGSMSPRQRAKVDAILEREGVA